MPDVFELIQQLCPDGVEYRRLGDVCRLVRGRVISKSYVNENAGEYPVFSSQTENDGVFGCISTYDFEGEFVTWTTDGAYAGSVFYRVGRFSITNVCGLIEPAGFDLSVKFLYFFLSVELRKHVRAGNNPKCMSNMVANVCIPVPPLPVQQKIVRILDAFDTYCNDMTTGLAGELAMRRKQFQYWREKLLTFDDGVERKSLGEVVEVLDNLRKPVSKSCRIRGSYPYYGANGIQDYVSDYLFDGTYVLVGEDGSVVTDDGHPFVNWVEGKIWVNNHAHIITERNGASLRYVFYCLQTLDVSKLVHGNIPKLTGSDFKNLFIPIPPLSIQQEIVCILDTFQELEKELEKELELRKCQFDYYRDRLLTFPEKEAV